MPVPTRRNGCIDNTLMSDYLTREIAPVNNALPRKGTVKPTDVRSMDSGDITAVGMSGQPLCKLTDGTQQPQK